MEEQLINIGWAGEGVEKPSLIKDKVISKRHNVPSKIDSGQKLRRKRRQMQITIE